MRACAALRAISGAIRLLCFFGVLPLPKIRAGVHDAFATVLVETGASIPASLATERELSSRLGQAEISGAGADELRSQLAGVKERRYGDVRRRQSATEGLLELEAELTKARQQVSEAKAAFASTVVLDFERRWAEGCRVAGHPARRGGSIERRLAPAGPDARALSGLRERRHRRPRAAACRAGRADSPGNAVTGLDSHDQRVRPVGCRWRSNRWGPAGRPTDSAASCPEPHSCRAANRNERRVHRGAGLPHSRVALSGRRIARPQRDGRRAALSLLAGP
jgi:hypothetical protein